MTGYIDTKKSINGLCTIVYDQITSEPPGHPVHLFCKKRCDRIKILFHKSDGYVPLYKRLDIVQERYRYPRDKSKIKSIT